MNSAYFNYLCSVLQLRIHVNQIKYFGSSNNLIGGEGENEKKKYAHSCIIKQISIQTTHLLMFTSSLPRDGINQLF